MPSPGGADFGADYGLEATARPSGAPINRFQGTTDLIVVGDCDHIQVRLTLSIRQNLRHGGHTVAVETVDVQVGSTHDYRLLTIRRRTRYQVVVGPH